MGALTVKRIVCLATSRMPLGLCIAGRELLVDRRPGGWVRPVSGRENEGVTESECHYEDGRAPRVLDVIDVPVLDAQPRDYQRENWLLDPNRCWVRVGRVDLTDLPTWLDSVGTLWLNGYSTASGQNDRIPTPDANFLDSSLCLIKVNLGLQIFAPGAAFGDSKRKVQGRFRFGGTRYGLWVTDPDYEQEYLQRPDGIYRLGECFLTISLGGPHTDGFSYKLIAAIIKS